MGCDQARTALSALADGEEPGITDTELRQHVSSCSGCRVYADRVAALRRVTLLTKAPAVPDRTEAIMAALRHAPDRRPVALRMGLAVIGVVQLAVALPLLAGYGADMPVHDARHLAALDIAVAVGFLVAAWRPGRIGGLLPVVTALVVALVVGAALDIAGGTVHLSAETPHLLAAAGLLGIWLLTRLPLATPVAR